MSHAARPLLLRSLALFALAHCNRGASAPAPPPVRPQLMPEATRVGPALTAPVVVAPVAPVIPADGPCTVDTAAVRELTTGRGDVRQMQLRAGPTDARLSADVLAAGAVTSYQWTLGAAPAVPVVLERYDSRLHGRSSAVVLNNAWVPVQYRAGVRGLGADPNNDDNPTSAGTYPRTGGMVGVRLVPPGGAAQDSPLNADLEEFVAAAQGDDVLFAGSGPTLECSMVGQCWRDGDRGSISTGYDSKSGYAVYFGRLTAGALHSLRLQHADCALQYRSSGGEDGDSRWVNASDPNADGQGEVRYNCSTATRERPDAVELASHPTHPAVLWRTRAGLFYALPPASATGPETVTVHPLATGLVGAATAAWDGDNLVAVWAQRTDARAPWVLQYARWSAASDAPAPAGTPLVTGTASAFAPTLQLANGRTTLTWMEGDAGHGVVRVASSYRGLAHVLDNALTVPANTPNARDPEVALSSAGAGWLAWVEYPVGRTQGGLVRAAPLRCP